MTVTRIFCSKVTIEDLRNFGMIPEFIGRLPIIFHAAGTGQGNAGEDSKRAEKCDSETVSEAAGTG